MPDDPEAQPQSQAERDAALLLLFLLLIRGTRTNLRATLQKFAASPMSVVDRYNTAQEAFGQLSEAHTQAVLLGRQRGGYAGEMQVADQVYGQAVAAEQAQYLAKFLDDLRAGRYTDPMTDSTPEEKWGSRADMYGRRLVGSAAAGWVAQQAPDVMYTWHTTATESCNTCKARDGQQYTQATLPGYPGDGGTECGANCLCFLEVSTPSAGSAQTSFELEGEDL